MSHHVSQDLDSVEGRYWHGIAHRMEPDSFNANYWFRRVGKHPIFAPLNEVAADILADSQLQEEWHLQSAWDPALFVNWCEQARHSPGSLKDAAALAIQQAEWLLLFNWCRRPRS